MLIRTTISLLQMYKCNTKFSLQSFAEMLHETVRRDILGYVGDEALTAAEMHKIKYEASCRNRHTM